MSSDAPPDESMTTAITLAYDAFRLCLGQAPVKWSRADVERWLRLMDRRPTGEQ